jgi:hypothetical protein
MHRLRNRSGGRLLVALVVAVAAFGIVNAVQASNPAARRAIPASAWAIVQSNGTITHGVNVTSVSHPATGVYCVHLNGINPSNVAAVVTATGVVGNIIAMNSNPGACGVGGPSVLVSGWNTSTSALTDTGFRIVVP